MCIRIFTFAGNVCIQNIFIYIIYQHDMQTIADICLYTEDVCRQIPVYVQKIHSLYVYIQYIFFMFLFTIISLCPLVGYVPGRDAIW